MTTPSFQSWCGECFEMVRYVHGRPEAHACNPDHDIYEEEND